MNTSPITTYEGAEAYFTFGPDSLGTWIFVVLAILLFCFAIVRAVRVESRHFDRIATQVAPPPGAAAAIGHPAETGAPSVRA